MGSRELEIDRLPELKPGSLVRVSLGARTVTFHLKMGGVWVQQHALTLPEDCGNISLGVTLCGGAKVTLLQ